MTTSCNCPVEEGMAIRTDTEEVVATRRVMANFILSRCPEVPAIQRIATSVGVEKPGFATEDPKEDCILCGLCVRAMRASPYSPPGLYPAWRSNPIGLAKDSPVLFLELLGLV